MKTRRTRSISILAAGFLAIFYAGCTSPNTKEQSVDPTFPDQPVDLKGEGMARAKGDKFAVSSKLTVGGSLSGSGHTPSQGSVSGGGSFFGARSNNAELEVTEVDGGGKATELRAFKIMQPFSWRVTVTAQRQTKSGKDEGQGSQHGKEYTMKNNEGEWEQPFAALQGIHAAPNLFPEEKISGGHKWKPDYDLFEDILDAMPDMRGSPRGVKPDGVGVEVTLKFQGLKEYKGENCAVIDIDISGDGKDSNSNAKLAITGDGEIYRSLDSFRNLKAWTKVRIRSRISERLGGRTRMTFHISMTISINEKEEMIHKAEHVPRIPDAKVKE